MKVFATSLTGKVQDIHGRIIINNNGSIETVVLGQIIPAGAELQFNDNATLTLATENNQQILLDGESQQILSESTITPINNDSSDIENIQALIASGDDPTIHTKATAAGSPTHAGGFDFVTLQRNGDELLATTDYSTAGQPKSILESDELFNNTIRHEGIIAKVDNYTVAEDDKIVLHLLDNDTSVSGDPLSIGSINGTPLTGGDQIINVDHGHISITTDGTITFIPKSNFNGDVNVDYTVTDGTSTQSSHTSIVVTPVNDAPVAQPDTLHVDEETVTAIDLTTNDTDLDGDTLHVTKINGTALTGKDQIINVAGGSIHIEDGAMTYHASKVMAGDSAEHNIHYTVSDGHLEASSTLTVGVNAAPVAQPDTLHVDEETVTAIDLTTNDTDLDGDTLHVTKINGTALTGKDQIINVAGGSIHIEDGAMTYHASKVMAGDSAEHNIHYTVSDGHLEASSTLTVGVNAAPVAQPDTLHVDEETVTAIDLTTNDTDLDGDTLHVTKINGTALTGKDQIINVAGGSIHIEDGAMTYHASKVMAGDSAEHNIHYTVSDGHLEASSTLTVGVNAAPVAQPDTLHVDEETVTAIDLTTNDTDLDGDTLHVTKINGTALTGKDQIINVAGGSIHIEDGAMTYHASKVMAGDSAEHNIHYTVSDGHLEASSTLTVGVNAAPVAQPDTLHVDEETVTAIDLTTNDTDLDGDTLHVTKINGTALTGKDQIINVAGGSIHIEDGAMTYHASEVTANSNVENKIDYTVSDGQLSSSSTATIVVKPIVDPVNVKVTVDLDGAEIKSPLGVTKHYTSWNYVVREYGKDAHTLTANTDMKNIINDGEAYRGMGSHDNLSAWQATDQGKGSVLIGGDGDLTNNHKVTGDGQDSLYGGYGNDILVGEQGNDALYGNRGIDTAVYSRKFSDYNITANIIDTSNRGGDHKFTVTDKLYNPHSSKLDNEGQDQLYNIERLQFSDGTYYWNEGSQSWEPEAITVTYPINIDAALTDTDGSEEITRIDISGIPKDSVLYDDAHNQLGVADADGHIVLMPSDWGLQSPDHIHVKLNNLHLEVAADRASNIALTVTATGHEKGTTQSAIGSDTTTLNHYTHQDGSYGDNQIEGDQNNNIVVGDTTGLQITQGENYNIAFILDTSGSMFYRDDKSAFDSVNEALKQIDIVLTKLKNDTMDEHSGHINVGLIDFSDTALSLSIDLGKYQSGDLVKMYLDDKIPKGSNTNYKAAFEATTKWFESKDIINNHGNNSTYFFTDGRPNVITDSNGYTSKEGDITKESLAAFDKLKVVSPIVDAIGMEQDVNASDLETYDTDGHVHAHINADQIANIVLGTETQLTQGNDNIHGNDGHDIIFGDIIKFNSTSDLQGFDALKEYIAQQEETSVSNVSTYNVDKYIQIHIGEFDLSHSHDGNDILHGDNGNDLIFGQGGDDQLFGGLGNDILLGGSGNDLLKGDTGNDVLIGGQGNDELWGGEGKDTFSWNHNLSNHDTDHIKDFNIHEDKLNLSDLLHNTTENTIDHYLTLHQDGNDTVLSVNVDARNDVEQNIVLDNTKLGDVKANLGVITNNLLHFDGDKLILEHHSEHVNSVYEPMVLPHQLIDEHNN
ncbi:retention module-containing protein [Photobacterium toruni]|uniref:RTX-I toxin determinant A from serotypes 1/9 n=1 Tax=Photobacterium toruni TaxID=1935446 RepID=A0A1T4Q376_9GAMM|nr:retention module-containing protein [Photobacterium toruni]SJZ98252.1 RTX-I toxin determinant A from serotypes 1/9 [Photobacterium toruni]